MRGISQLWRWMLAEGIIEDMKQTDEIVGSDSSAGISILERKGSSRRTKQVELKVFFLQAYCRLDDVKVMMVKTEDMLSDSFTKVMTMPRHHVPWAARFEHRLDRDGFRIAGHSGRGR